MIHDQRCLEELREREEERRLAELRAYGILDTANDPALDALVREVARTFAVPVAMIALIDQNRQWFKARVGVEAQEMPRTISFCTHAIKGAGVFVVTDASKHQPFASFPFVCGDPNVRFYAGAPLKTPSGRRIGTVCVIDTKVRPEPDLAFRRALECFAARAMQAFERHKLRAQRRAEAEARVAG